MSHVKTRPVDYINYFLGVKVEEKFLLKIKKELNKYQNIPKDLYNYIEKAFKKDVQEHLLPVISIEKARKRVLKNIDNLFKKASDITKLSTVDLIKALDFRSKDINLGRIDAAFAELRTINFLYNLNLYDIIPLQAKKDEKSADFIAMGGSEQYAIEVFCKISQSPPRPGTVKELKKDLETNSKMIEPLTYEDDLFRYFMNISTSKKPQLDNTSKKYKCNKKMMVLVLDDRNISGFLMSDEGLKILSKISTELKWGDNYHFAIVTGLASKDTIYPPITL